MLVGHFLRRRAVQSTESSKTITAWYCYRPGTRHWSQDDQYALCGVKIQPDWTKKEHGSTLVWCSSCNEVKAELENRERADSRNGTSR
jgi:hypothetical protein